MKRSFLVVTLMLIAIILSAKTVDRIVAKVGKEIILQSELDKRYEQYKAFQIINEDVTKDEILEDMIESELVVIAALAQGLETDKLNIKNMAENQIEELKSNYKNELEFRQALSAETGMTPTELKDYYITMITEQQLRDDIIRSVIETKTHVTEAEVKEYYDENLSDIPDKPEMDEIGMILINVSAGEETKDKALKDIIEIKDKLNKGGNFAELAKEYSDCPSSSQGGDLGFFERGMMVKPFEDAAFSLSPGEVSDVVETQFGYHLILVEEKKEDQVKASHILKKIEASEEDKRALVELAGRIREDLVNGANFGELAKEYSMDETSAENGGVIGEFTQDNYPELFSDQIKKLGYGEYSEVINEGESYYIFAKIKKIDSRPFSYEELYDDLRSKVLEQKQSEMYDRWINELKKNTYIEMYL